MERHRLGMVNTTKATVLGVLANSADDAGLSRMRQHEVKSYLTVSLLTVKRAFISMQRTENGGPFLRKAPGRGWVIVGVAEHDVMTCPHPDCRATAAIPDGETPEQRKRRKTLERVRRHRERQRRAAQTG